MRVQVGIFGAVATVAVAAALLGLQVDRPWRLLVAIPALVTAMGFFQAQAQTCVAFASKGIRVLGDSRSQAEAVNAEVGRRIAAQARAVYRNAFLTTAAVTALVWAMPTAA